MNKPYIKGCGRGGMQSTRAVEAKQQQPRAGTRDRYNEYMKLYMKARTRFEKLNIKVPKSVRFDIRERASHKILGTVKDVVHTAIKTTRQKTVHCTDCKIQCSTCSVLSFEIIQESAFLCDACYGRFVSWVTSQQIR